MMLLGRNRWTMGWLLTAALGMVCSAQQQQFGPAMATPENTAATVVSMAGQVSLLRDNSPRAEPWALNTGDVVRQRQVVVTGSDGTAIFQVNDGSTFQVYPNSRVTFRNNPNWKDLLDVWIGRVKVHIQRWGGQPNPSRIHTPTAVITVRGTTFDVESDADESTLVSVEEGQVDVRHRLIMQEQPRLLNQGEEIRVYKNVPLAKARLDKGGLVQRGMNALGDAFYTIMMRGPGSGGGSTPVPGAGGGASPVPGGGGPRPGDTGAEPPPPPPPAAPPPPI
ncbi:MAG: FecR domain-containing protein [Acidobacteriia bacterium]|nr:FecR domain-containing protein [Terriglobia bacterium]